jgi:hypothetical protein
MTNRLILSKPHQEEVAAQAASAARLSRDSMKKSLKWLGGFAAATAALVVALPAAPALIAGLIGGSVAMVAGTYAASHFAAAREMDKQQKNVGTKSFVNDLWAKSSRLGKINKVSDRTSTIGLFANVGLLAVGLIFPPAAIVTEPVRFLAIMAWGGGALVTAATRAESHSLRDLSLTATAHAARDTLDATLAPANDGAPSKITNAPAPGLAFDKAVKGAEVANDAAAPKPAWKRALRL